MVDYRQMMMVTTDDGLMVSWRQVGCRQHVMVDCRQMMMVDWRLCMIADCRQNVMVNWRQMGWRQMMVA